MTRSEGESLLTLQIAKSRKVMFIASEAVKVGSDSALRFFAQ